MAHWAQDESIFGLIDFKILPVPVKKVVYKQKEWKVHIQPSKPGFLDKMPLYLFMIGLGPSN